MSPRRVDLWMSGSSNTDRHGVNQVEFGGESAASRRPLRGRQEEWIVDCHWQPPGWLRQLVDVMTAFEIDPEGGPGGEILGRDGLVWTKLPVMKRTLRDHMPGTIGCHRVGPESVVVWWELDQPAAAWTLICREPPAEVQAEMAEARAAGGERWQRP